MDAEDRVRADCVISRSASRGNGSGDPLRFWPEPVWAPGPFEKVELRDFDLSETENPMTEDRLALAELPAKSGDPDFLRTIAESVLQLIMEADVDGLIGTGCYERGEARQAWRNGYRDRTLDTRLGTLNLKIPKMRSGAYFPGFLEPRKTVEKALVAVIQEAWINGVSPRKVDELVQAMGMTRISKSSVSKLCKDIDERVNAFLKRPLSGDWPYLWLEAAHLKMRESGRIVSVAAIIAVAGDTDGKREIVGLHIDPPPPTGPKRLLVESWPRGQRGRRSWFGLRSRPRGDGGHEDLRRGRLVSERATRADGVEVPPPAFHDDLRLREGVEDLAVEEFVAQPGIERLDEAVLPGTAGRDVGGLGTDRADPILHGFGDELGTVV